MNVLCLNDIDYSKVKKQFGKTVEFLGTVQPDDSYVALVFGMD